MAEEVIPASTRRRMLGVRKSMAKKAGILNAEYSDSKKTEDMVEEEWKDK